MVSELTSFIERGEFEKAIRYAHCIDEQQLEKDLLYIAYESESLAIYTFLTALLIELETWRLHNVAFKLLTSSFGYFEGAYVSAAYHVRRAIEITSSQEIEPLENLLVLHTEKEDLVSKEEAIKTANALIALDEHNKIGIDKVKQLQLEE